MPINISEDYLVWWEREMRIERPAPGNSPINSKGTFRFLHKHLNWPERG
ncbi:MAG: hypothetical protein ACR2I2_06675 [Bryobacteraceae bacterium]